MKQYVCDKCANKHYTTGQFQATGGTLSKLFDIQTEKFHTVSCSRCGFTEVYRATSSTGENVLDFLFGG